MIHTANEFTKIHHRHLLSGYAAGLHPLPAGSVVEAPAVMHRSTRSATAQQQQVGPSTAGRRSVVHCMKAWSRFRDPPQATCTECNMKHCGIHQSAEVVFALSVKAQSEAIAAPSAGPSSEFRRPQRRQQQQQSYDVRTRQRGACCSCIDAAW